MEAEGTQFGPGRAEDEEFLTPSRRGFLRAAALGVGATAVGWSQLKPLAVLAHDLSGLNCTANDVQILGAGQVLNEPCDCSGNFNAVVRFTVRNNAAADRRCVTLHLCPVELPDGTTFDPGDIILGDIAGKTTATIETTIPNFPCGAGLLCFGTFLPGQDNADTKGLRCPAGACCSTVSWTVRPNEECGSDADVIPSKCRHQQICIQGRGVVTLDCDPTQAGTNCSIDCGDAATLRACITGGPGPFVFELLTGGQVIQRFPAEGTTTDTCHDFTVMPGTTTNFIARVTDSTGCSRSSAAVTVTVRNLSPVINFVGNSNCSGLLTVTTTVDDFTGCSFAYTIDGVAAAATETDGTIVRLNTPAAGEMTVRFLDGACHEIGVTATCGGCVGTATRTFTQCVDTDLNC